MCRIALNIIILQGNTFLYLNGIVDDLQQYIIMNLPFNIKFHMSH